MANSTWPEGSTRRPRSDARVTTLAATTAVVVEALLFAGFASAVVLAMLAVAVMIVPAAVAAFTWTTMPKSATAPFGTDGLVQVMVPVPPTGGVAHVQPAGGVIARKFVFAGMANVIDAPDAVVGPLFVTCTA